MKNKLTVLLVVAVVLVAAALLFAQSVPGSLVQSSPTRLDAATNVQHSHTSAATITLTASGSQSIYITAIDITDCAGTTVTAATPLFITTTGITGSPQYMAGTTGTAGMCDPATMIAFQEPLKSQTPGTNVTFVLPTFTTQQTISVNVYYYLAP